MGIPGVVDLPVVVYLDDVLVTAPTDEKLPFNPKLPHMVGLGCIKPLDRCCSVPHKA